MNRISCFAAFLFLSACTEVTDRAAPFETVITSHQGRQIITRMWTNQLTSDEVCIAYENGTTDCVIEHSTTNRFEVRDAAGTALALDDDIAAEAGIDAVCKKAGFGGTQIFVASEYLLDGVFVVKADCDNQPGRA